MLRSNRPSRSASAFARSTLAVAGIGALAGGFRLRKARAPLLAVGGALVVGALRPAARGDVAKTQDEIAIRRVATAAASADDLFALWNDPARLVRAIPNAISIVPDGPDRWKWTVRAAGRKLRWTSEIVERRPAAKLAWRTTEDADVASEGAVTFTPLPGDRGTEIAYALRIRPPYGRAGKLVARAFGDDPGTQMQRTLHAVKAIAEAGEIPTSARTKKEAGR